MNNFSKIVILILLVLSFFFVKEKYENEINSFLSSIETLKNFHINKTLFNTDEEERVKQPTQKVDSQKQQKKELKKENDVVTIYFLALDSDDKGIYKKVTRDVPIGENKLDFAIKELIKGPNIVEKSMGAYSEVPKETKLLGIKQTSDKVIIDFSSDFQYGGGTDSVYSRMMQLIKTSVTNVKNKDIYLYLDGKKIDMIGGEGIMISQPLTENSLDL